MPDRDVDAEQERPRRPVRSYVIRSGRLTTAQSQALENHADDFVIDYRPEPIDLARLFGNQHDTIVEIGFGMGDSLLEMAVAHPERNYIGVEVHRPGIGKLLLGINREKLANLRIINHDAREVMEHCFQDRSLAGVQIFFPDPWHKKRHHKRRLIQPDFIRLLVNKLRAGGRLHLATDWQPYAEQMLEVLEDEPDLINLAGPGNFSATGERPPTRFEKRGRKLGHGVWDLQFSRR
jgi:tRNA (guanine-N7-)-methyltransferase